MKYNWKWKWKWVGKIMVGVYGVEEFFVCDVSVDVFDSGDCG